MEERKNVLDLDLFDDASYQESNWAEFIDKPELERLGKEIVEDVQRDARSRAAWMSEMDMWLDMAAQVIEEKNTPWEGASNIKFPLLTTAALQFHARAQGELLKGDKLVKAKVVGEDMQSLKAARAKRVGSAMSTQLMYQMEDWQDDTDRLLFVLPLVGTVFRKTYWSKTVGRPVSELVLPSDLIVNYWATDWERCRKTHSFLKPKNEVEEAMRLGTYIECTLPAVAEPPKEDADPTDTEAPDSEDTGGADFDPKDVPFTLYECHYWWDLDGDGYAEPYIVTVLKDIQKVVRIVPRYDLSRIDWKPGDEGDDEIITRIRPYEYVISYKFLPDLDSSIYGVGFGKLIGPTGAAVDTLINVLMDSGTLSTMPSGFFGRGLRVSRGGSIRLRPGEWRRVNVSGEDLQKNFYPLPAKEPSGVLFNLLGMLIQAGEQIGSSTQTMKGENPGQNTPSRTFNELQESGMQVFLGIYKRIYRSLTKEYRMLALLNYMYLSPDAYEGLLDQFAKDQAEAQAKQAKMQQQAAQQGEEGQAAPQPPAVEPPVRHTPQEDFNPEGLDIVPEADPNLENSWRKKQRSQQLIEARNAGMPLNDELITRLYLEAIEEPDIEEMMQVADPPPSEAELNHQVKMRELDLKEKELMMNAQLRQYEPMKEMAQARESLAKAQSLAGEEQKAQLELYIKQIESQMKQSEQAQKAFLDMMLMGKKIEVEDAKVDAHRARTAAVSRQSASGD